MSTEEKTNATVAKAKVKVPVERLKKQALADLEFVRAKYIGAGWATFNHPPNSIMDLMCHKGKICHHIVIVPDGKEDEPRFTDLSKNTFIQNAMSNNSIPIFAYMAGGKIELRDINLDKKIIIRAQADSEKK